MRNLIPALFLCLLIAGFPLFAQDADSSDTEYVDDMDSLDDLFSAPEDDIVVEKAPEVDHRKAFEKSDTVKIKGKYEASGIVAGGWTSWDFLSDISQDFDPSLGLTSSASVSFDARPATEFRVYGNLATTFNPLEGLDDWESISINELFCDYILADFLYARLGKHTIKWGQGYLYNPGNLMSDSAANYNFRVSFPAVSGLTFVILSNQAVSYSQLVYAAKADFILGGLMISPAYRFNLSEGSSGLVSLKHVIFKTDILLDVAANYNDGWSSLDLLTGFFREWEDIKLYGEYKYHWFSNGHVSQDAGLAVGFNNPFNAPFDVGVQVLHSFMKDSLWDNSGTFTVGLSQKIWPFVTMDIALPVVYGGDESYAVVNNEDPSGRRIALGLSLTLSGTF